MKKCLIVFCVCLLAKLSKAQEAVAPLLFNASLNKAILPQTSKKVRAGLPFFEDFSNLKSPYPNATLWEGQSVYINNTFASEPPSCGVATFDALDANGQAYHPSGFPVKFSADTLTSVAIDLSTNTPGDSIYLSFFNQAGGNGFAPEGADSLTLYFLGSNNSWVRVWAKGGGTSQPFEQVLLPISSSIFLHNNFKLRFINTASPNTNDDIWNIDYIKIDKNRKWNDIILNDVAMLATPNSLLKDYTSKPISHLTSNDIETFCGTSIINNSNINRDIRVKFKATNITLNTILRQDSIDVTVAALSDISLIIPSYTVALNTPLKQTIEHQFYYQDTSILGRKVNDTIYGYTQFDNYFAYDDGSAEKAYYLLGLQGTPMSTALKFDLTVADSVQGLAIKFGGQTPTAADKPFTITLYKKLDTSTALQEIIYTQNFFEVNYENAINQFSYYKFDTAQFLQPGTYYIGTTQQPFSGADTLYFGLDVNTSSNTKNLYFNIDSRWQKSTLAGSVMFRPLVGSANSFVPTTLSTTKIKDLNVYPNPVQNILHVQNGDYQIFNAYGSIIQKGRATNQTIDVANLISGTYFLKLQQEQQIFTTTFIKQ